MHEYLLEAERSMGDRPTEITCKSKWYYHGANKQLIGCSLTTSTILNFVQFVVSSDDLPPELIKNFGAKHIELDSTQPKKAIGFGSINYWKDGRETYDNTKVVYEYSNGLKATFTSLTANAKDVNVAFKPLEYS